VNFFCTPLIPRRAATTMMTIPMTMMRIRLGGVPQLRGPRFSSLLLLLREEVDPAAVDTPRPPNTR